MTKQFMVMCILIGLAVMPGCKQIQPEPTEELYNKAVADSVFAEADEVYDKLAAITPENEDLLWQNGRVLVVTFTKYPDSYPEGKSIQTWWGTTWVTIVPHIQEFFESPAGNTDNTTLRVKQILGLPRESTMEWFAELWVDPADLFRPCPDEEIDDSVCELTMPDNASQEHIEWFNQTIIESYFSEKRFPWTRLGYTYDWGNPGNEIGLAEFVLRQDSEVLVQQLSDIETYIGK